MQDFRNLKVWGNAHQQTLKIYGQISTFPKEKLTGLASQLRRSVSSIPTNIAKGGGRVPILILPGLFKWQCAQFVKQNASYCHVPI